jgi:hypothetical protein
MWVYWNPNELASRIPSSATLHPRPRISMIIAHCYSFRAKMLRTIVFVEIIVGLSIENASIHLHY